MKNMKKRIMTLLLTGAVAVSGLAGCSGKNGSTGKEDNDQHLEVYCWQAGYGTEWLEAMLKDFGEQDWVKKKYPDFSYSTVINDDNTYGGTRVTNPDSNTIDLLFTQNMEWYYGNDDYLLDLTDPVYNSEVPDDSGKKFIDKVRPDFLDTIGYLPEDENEARYYTVPWGSSIQGLIYNATLLKELGLEVPRTTDEFFALMETVKSWGGKNAKYPYTYSIISSQVSYIDSMFTDWWAQYEGVENYKKFWNGIDEDDVRNSVKIFEQQGRLESLKVMEKMFRESYGYYDRASSNYDFIQGQSRLLIRQGLFFGNGDWFSKEMQDLAQGYKEEGYDDKMGMMTTPVISSIVNQTPSIKETAAAQGKTDDEILSFVVSEIDEGKTSSSLATVAQNDFDRIREARGIVYNSGCTHNGVIPANASAKDVAVDFLRYMATDRACTIYAECTAGGRQGFTFDLERDNKKVYDKMMKENENTFNLQSDCSKLIARDFARELPFMQSFPLGRDGGVKYISGCEADAISAMFVTYDKSAQYIFDRTIEYWNENNQTRWNRALNQAGLN